MIFKNVLIVSDLDGTLLDDKKNIAEEDMKAINTFRDKGGYFYTATGRGVPMARRVIDKLGVRFSVIFNGAAVYDFKSDRMLWHSNMPDISDEYIRMLEEVFPDIGIEILYENDVCVTSDNPTVQDHLALEGLSAIYCGADDLPLEGRMKVLVAYPADKMQAVIDFTHAHCMKGVNWVHSAPMYYEMLPEGVSKAAGVKKLIELLRLQDKFVVAVGDYGNDKAMIEEADLGVAVGNALDCVKKAADLVVSDNNHAPMKQIIEHIQKL